MQFRLPNLLLFAILSSPLRTWTYLLLSACLLTNKLESRVAPTWCSVLPKSTPHTPARRTQSWMHMQNSSSSKAQTPPCCRLKAPVATKFLELDFLWLFDHLRTFHARERRSGGSFSRNDRELKYVSQGRLSTAAKALHHTEVSKPIAELRTEMQKKMHMLKEVEIPDPATTTTTFHLPQIEVANVIADAGQVNKYTASGPSGMPMFALVDFALPRQPSMKPSLLSF